MEPHHGKTYIVTHDVPTRVQSLQQLGIASLSASDPLLTGLSRRLRAKIQSILPEAQIIDYDMPMLSEKIWAEALRKQRALRNALVISTCQEMASARRGHTLEINRIVDINGSIIGFGPRPGSPPLSKQVASLVALANGAPVVIVEDGAFSGSTLKYVISMLTKNNLPVSSVVIGFSFPGVTESIEEEFGIPVTTIEDIPRPIDWMPDHDFFPLIPNCGRIYGSMNGTGEAHPYYSEDGASYSIPYIQPFGDLEHWGTIPQNRVTELSVFCLEHTIRIFDKIEKLNDRSLTFGDLSGAKPSVSIPLTKGVEDFPLPDTPILEFLRKALEKVS
jgi:hypothetical protein